MLLSIAALVLQQIPNLYAAELKATLATKEAYASDFLVFVGAAEGRRAVFAADFNRGKRGDKLQHEQWFVFHLESQGWIELPGGGEYKVSGAAPLDLAASPQYRLEGSDAAGWKLSGKDTHPQLETQALAERSTMRDERGLFTRATGAASLVWKGKRYAGRAVREVTLLRGLNLITDPEASLFGDGWNGLYALAGTQEFVFHQTGGKLTQLLNERAGFTLLNDKPFELRTGRFRADRWEQASGFYRWPGRWRVDQLPLNARLEVELRERNTLVNWVFGGAGVAIATGSFERDGQRVEVYGLAQFVR